MYSPSPRCGGAHTHTMAFLSLVAFLLCFLAPVLLIFKSARLRRGSNSSSSRGKRLPPSPPALPLLGHLHLLGSLPHRSLRSLAASHGPVVLLRLGRVPTVVVSSAAAAEEVLRTRDLAFASRPRMLMAERLLYGRDVAFAPYGEYWRQARRICVAHLLSARRTLSFRRVREQEAAALVARVRERSDSGVVVELSDLLIAYANNVVSRAAFGARGLYEEDRELRKVFAEFQELLAAEPLGELLPCLAWVDSLVYGLDSKIKRTFQALDAVLEKVIDDHRQRPPTTRQDDGEHQDFVDVLLDVNKNFAEYGIRFETNEIKALILDMFAGGTDTTTTAMEWAMAELVTHPRAMRKLQGEVRAAVKDTGHVTEEHLDSVPYLKAVIKETLRLHVPVPLLVPREPSADAEILGYHVPAGTRVVINAWAIARDPATWGRHQDADQFVPERFLPGGSAAAVDYKGQSFELLPFGAGRRGCPGVGFAEQSMELALASLLYHFNWEAAPGTSLDMSETNGLAVHIKSGLPLVAKPFAFCC